jgi:hypothetical protein
MKFMKKIKFKRGLLAVLGVVSVSFSVFSAEDERMNVMECSHNEVLAYLNTPEPADAALRDYTAFRKAYVQSRVKQAEKDGNPGDCVALLYGDLQAMYERTKAATDLMMAGNTTLSSALVSQALDALGGTLCERVDAGTSDYVNAYVEELQSLQAAQLSEVKTAFGQSAFEGQGNKYAKSNFLDLGLEYRNGQLDPEAFRKKANGKWKGKMRAMKKQLPPYVEQNYGN